MQFKTKRRLIIGISLLLILILYIFKNYFLMVKTTTIIFGTVIFVFGLSIFYFFDHTFYIHFHFRHYLYLLAILIFGILFSPLYFYSEIYDKILHLLMPILGSIIIFFMINKSDLKFQWKLFITLIFMVFLLTIFEVGEYLFDVLWDLKLQGVYLRDISGLEKYKLVLGENDDTMIDLILGIAGSLIFVLAKTGIFYYKKFKKYKKIKKKK